MSALERALARLTDTQRAQLCPTCVDETGTTRYCARFACLCGHDKCHAFLSYLPRKAPADVLANVIAFPVRPDAGPAAEVV